MEEGVQLTINKASLFKFNQMITIRQVNWIQQPLIGGKSFRNYGTYQAFEIWSLRFEATDGKLQRNSATWVGIESARAPLIFQKNSVIPGDKYYFEIGSLYDDFLL